MKTDLAPTRAPELPSLEIMPRADLPVIWDGFKAKAEELRNTAETLVVNSIAEKDKMELARTTRLTLRGIRIAVEKKRAELGEGYLAEIKKINSAATAIKEAIEPLEARLLHAETFAERWEADRIVELTKRRNDEVRSIWPGCPGDFGKMSDEEYNALISRLRSEAAEIAEAKRKQAEAEAALAVQRAAEQKLREEQAAALAAQQAEAQRQARAAAAEAEIRLAAERAELQRQNERVRQEYEEQSARERAVQAEKDAEEKRVRDEREAVQRAELEAEIARNRAERQAEEARRLELEHQLAIERADKLAEERRLHAIALAPDKEQLKEFKRGIYNIPQPDLKTVEAIMILEHAQSKLAEAMLSIDVFCETHD